MGNYNLYGEPLYWRPYENEFLEKSRIAAIENENEFLKKELKNSRGKVKRVKLPEKYIINENATILFWNKTEKTIVKKSADDEFNARLGFLTAFFQHYCGMSRNKANKYLASLEVERR